MYVCCCSQHCDDITEFLTKILLFPEDCASQGLSQDLSDKKTVY